MGGVVRGGGHRSIVIRLRWAWALAWGVLMLAIHGFAAASASAAPRADSAPTHVTTSKSVVARVLADAEFQTTFPETPPARPTDRVVPKQNSFWDNLLTAIRSVFRAMAPALKIGLWVIGIGGLIYLLILLSKAIGDGKRPSWRRRPPPAPTATGPIVTETKQTPSAVPNSLSEAERLAWAGAYGAAIHFLLLAAIELLIQQSNRPVGDCLTAREISRLPHLPEAARSPFAALTLAAEHYLFAGQAASAAAYERCRALQHSIAATLDASA